jgi:hypothetical protein
MERAIIPKATFVLANSKENAPMDMCRKYEKYPKL